MNKWENQCPDCESSILVRVQSVEDFRCPVCGCKLTVEGLIQKLAMREKFLDERTI